ncbi:MAG TPA: tetratricopeptide repeat protein [Streptosporangiaceae bacterium]|nr:tetratricopeptide repeat protein [Streptosporangiaceae bacterium]
MTTATTACQRPGCGGIIEDGYCNVCGLAPAPPVAPGPQAPPAAAATTACQRPGCGGMIEDGYCNVCGLAAESRPAAAGAGSRSAPVPRSGSVSFATRGSAGTRASRPGSSRSSRGSLGAGLVQVPPVPARDPASAVLSDPQVPESKRFCGACEQPVGRGANGRPGLTEGFCRHCGTPFSFRSKLATGELVAGQYEVLGCLAHGGLGWIYLARDRNVSDRWVVLKGLLNTGDADAMAAAVAERQFLAEVEHPNIVRIYNFVQHGDRRTGGSAGYIVMEYAGGQSLKQILAERRKAGESLSLPVALAYALEILPALGYLHDRGLVYCDFKPDNVIQTEEQLKLIDLGGVRRIDDVDSPIYGTVGYQAPEIADRGPSPSSDLYTVGRALAVLTFEFSGYTGTYSRSLPDPAKVPLLAQQESFYRFLRRATDPDPGRRFTSASEMAEQLTGVLREVLAVGDGRPRPAISSLFSPEPQVVGAGGWDAADGRDGATVPCGPSSPAGTAPPGAAEIVAGLPVPLVDSTDPAVGYLAALSALNPAQRTATLSAAVAGEPGTPPEVAASAETRLALARALVVSGDPAGARAVLADLAADGQADWRVAWYEALSELAAGNPGAALGGFNAVCDTLPGELAPKLACGLTAEAAGDHVLAARCFQLVSTVDPSYVSAAFGLARTHLVAGDRTGAIAALAAIPETSSHYVTAQIAAIRIQVAGRRQAAVTGDDVREASDRLNRMKLDAARQHQLTAEILRAALGCLAAGQAVGGGRLLGCEPTERALRFGLERSYRALARLAPDPRLRVELVDLANDVRPRTFS